MASSAAWTSFEQMLKSYGLGELVAWAKQQFTEGRSIEEINLSIEDQPVFRRKFAAIFTRREKGLPPVSVQDLVNYRSQALQLEHAYGLPPGVVSDETHINAFVGGDVSFNELQDRVQRAALLTQQSPPEAKQWIADNLGIGSDGLLTAYMLDPEHSWPYIERVATGALIGGAARRQGFGNITAAEADRLALAGVTSDQAAQGFGQLAQAHELLDPLAGSAETAIGRDLQLGLVEGTAAAQEAFQKRARERTAATREGGGFAGRALVSGTDR